MKLDYLKEKKELVPVALLVVSAVLVVLAAARVVGFFMASARAETIVKKAVELNNAGTVETEQSFAKSREIADALKRVNLFAPPPPKEHPVKTVPAILGDTALINGQWLKVGATVGGAKILAIGPTGVKIEWEGSEKTFLPINAESSEGGGRPTSGRTIARAGGPGGDRADTVVIGSQAGRPRPDGSRFAGGGGPRGGFEAMRDRFANMSEADRNRLRDEMQQRRARYESMSEAERERFRNEMRERFGGGRGPSGGGPGGGRGGPGGGGSRGGR
jgi:hypothetical protein